MLLKRQLMLENLPMWLNYNRSTKMSEPQFLHSAVMRLFASYHKHLIGVVAAKRVDQPVIRFGFNH